MPDDLVPGNRLFTREKFFDDRLLDTILAECRHSADAAGAIFRNTDTLVDEGYRRCRVVSVSVGLEGEIANHLGTIQPEIEDHFRAPLRGFQQPRLLLYRKGDFFVPHQDSDAQGPPWLRERKVTAVVFINGQEGSGSRGDYRGGTLTLYRLNGGMTTSEGVRTRVQGQPGLLVAFRASLFHEVSRITMGARYSVVTWFY